MNEKSLVIDQNLALLMTDIYLHYKLLWIKIDFLHILSAYRVVDTIFCKATCFVAVETSICPSHF